MALTYWISCQWLAFLSNFSRWQLIQNSMPSTIVLRQCDIWIRVPLKTMNNARIDSNRLLGIKSAIGFLRMLNNLSIYKTFYIWKRWQDRRRNSNFWFKEKFGYYSFSNFKIQAHFLWIQIILKIISLYDDL